MTLVELLEALCKVDPGRYREVVYCNMGAFQFVLAGDHHIVTPDESETDRIALLEYALREAIEARGWTWNVGAGIRGGILVRQAIVCSTTCSMARDNTPAIALGMAYLKALGVEA